MYPGPLSAWLAVGYSLTQRRLRSGYDRAKLPEATRHSQPIPGTCQHAGPASAQLPWDLLIVDEAHSLTPNHFGADGDLARMLRIISPQFEHRLFLSATPHNGYTRSFTGLLQQLDHVRFHQSPEIDQQHVKEVVIRRLKREIKQADKAAGHPERFAGREVDAVPL